jgi:hypothetical protein
MVKLKLKVRTEKKKKKRFQLTSKLDSPAHSQFSRPHSKEALSVLWSERYGEQCTN